MIDHEEFLHLYQNSKTDWTEYPYVPLMDAPLQARNYHCLGFLVDLSADQPTKMNAKGLSEKMEFGVGISFGNLPMDREYLNNKWEDARCKSKGNKRETFQRAPQPLNVYMEEKSLQSRASMAKKMVSHYGEMKDGKYPMFPYGSRMRFMPNHKLVHFNKKEGLEAYANLQVTLKGAAVTLNIGIKYPQEVMEKIENITMGELI